MQSVLSICQGLPEKVFQQGDILMHEGGRDKLIYVLIEGGVDIYKGDILVSSQFVDRDDHLGMVDEVLESLLHEQVEEIEPGSVRYPDDTID
jgi:CRP-like cAMP-binding protein